MSPSKRREMIRKDNTKLSLTRQCKLLKISRSSIYYTPVGMNAETLKLMHEIDRVFTKYPFFVRHEYFLHPKLGNLQEVLRDSVHIYNQDLEL